MSILKQNQRALIVAIDHARTHGLITGLENPGQVIDQVVEAGADAIITTLGVVKHYRDRLIGHIPTILRLDGGPSRYREDWAAYTEWHLLHTVEDALRLGVDGVVLMVFIGLSIELDTFRIVARVAGDCLEANLSLLVEAIPCQSNRIPDPKAAEAIAAAARLGFEHGADVIKSYYTGSPNTFRHVVASCPAPILITGGPRMETVEDVLTMTHGAMQAGGAGIVFGRNIWQSSNIGGTIAALRHIIHHNGSVSEALAKQMNYHS